MLVKDRGEKFNSANYVQNLQNFQTFKAQVSFFKKERKKKEKALRPESSEFPNFQSLSFVLRKKKKEKKKKEILNEGPINH